MSEDLRDLTVVDDQHISNDMLVVWYQSLLNRYNSYNSAIAVIDNKSSIVLAASVAVLIFGAEIQEGAFTVLGAIGLSGLIISIILALVNINLVKYSSEVNSSDDRPDYYRLTNDAFIWQLIADIELGIKNLEYENIKKARIYQALTSFFAASSIFLLLSNYITLSITF